MSTSRFDNSNHNDSSSPQTSHLFQHMRRRAQWHAIPHNADHDTHTSVGKTFRKRAYCGGISVNKTIEINCVLISLFSNQKNVHSIEKKNPQRKPWPNDWPRQSTARPNWGWISVQSNASAWGNWLTKSEQTCPFLVLSAANGDAFGTMWKQSNHLLCDAIILQTRTNAFRTNWTAHVKEVERWSGNVYRPIILFGHTPSHFRWHKWIQFDFYACCWCHRSWRILCNWN